MKYILIICLFVFPSVLYAQQCNLKKQKDPYTRELKISTGFIELDGAMVSIEATKTEIDFMFSIPGGKCFDDASSANVFFDSSRLKTNFKNSGTMNCDGLFHFSFRNTPLTQTGFQNLGTKKIKSIKFKDNTAKETEIVFTPEQQVTFMNVVACMITESKTLIPPPPAQ